TKSVSSKSKSKSKSKLRRSKRLQKKIPTNKKNITLSDDSSTITISDDSEPEPDSEPTSEPTSESTDTENYYYNQPTDSTQTDPQTDQEKIAYEDTWVECEHEPWFNTLTNSNKDYYVNRIVDLKVYNEPIPSIS